MVTTTLAWWQIGALILLTLTVVGILRRLVTLTGMVALHLWFKHQQSPTNHSVGSHRKSDSSALDEKRLGLMKYGSEEALAQENKMWQEALGELRITEVGASEGYRVTLAPGD